jgi:two-component system, cell cycle sensor histidine kinase and response regulator CckA
MEHESQTRDDLGRLLAVEEELQRVVHELKVHQVELEAQNEELRQAQSSLEVARDRFADLYDFAPVGYVTVSEKGLIREANLTLSRLLGVERIALMGKPFSRFVVKKDANTFHLHLQEVLETQSNKTGEVRLAVKDGSLMHARLESLPVSDESRELREIRLVVSDVTDLKRAEGDKARLEVELRQAQKMEAVGTLAGGIAHEFNNILGIILGNAELAALDIPEWSSAGHHIETIKAASGRARDVVRHLLTFSRKTQEHCRPLNLVPVMQEAMDFLRSSIPASIEFRRNVADQCRTVSADPTQIHQVIINLCTNAAHAIKEDGIVEFSLQNVDCVKGGPALDERLKPGEYVMLQVSDTGCGISPDVRDRIFDPYFTTKGAGEGTGMGLAVVYGIVQAHGGVIQVESAPGNGTTFKIFLPAIPDAPSAPGTPTDALPTGTERVLLVDDEEQLAILGCLQLESLGYRVHSETNPGKALAVFKDDPQQFDLVITDMTMPGMTGDQLIREVLRIRPDIPVILCTGYSERVDRERAESFGARAYASKPLSRNELATVVCRVLHKKGSD